MPLMPSRITSPGIRIRTCVPLPLPGGPIRIKRFSGLFKQSKRRCISAKMTSVGRLCRISDVWGLVADIMNSKWLKENCRSTTESQEFDCDLVVCILTIGSFEFQSIFSTGRDVYGHCRAESPTTRSINNVQTRGAPVKS